MSRYSIRNTVSGLDLDLDEAERDEAERRCAARARELEAE